MATIKKEDCSCPRRKKPTCPHKPYRVSYREPGGRAGKPRQVSFKKLEDAEASQSRSSGTRTWDVHQPQGGTAHLPTGLARMGRGGNSRRVLEEELPECLRQPLRAVLREQTHRQHHADDHPGMGGGPEGARIQGKRNQRT